jgi:hypothetical protein
MEKKEPENLQKLRVLVTKLQGLEFEPSSDQYKKLTDKIDSLLHEELKKLEYEKDTQNKLQCYESLFASIVVLLEGVKQIV